MANPEESDDEGMKVDEEPIWEGSQPDIDLDSGDKPLSAAISEGVVPQGSSLEDDREPTVIPEGAAPEVKGAKWIGKESKW
eukprot:5063419-Amphidinium_carterae.1